MSSPEQPGATVLPVAIAQMRMHWTGEENARQIVALRARAAAAGAQVCVFPELALTGFHRHIGREAGATQVQRWISSVAEACAAHSIAASLGAPTFATDGGIHNSNVFIDSQGRPAGEVHKNGLTPAEQTFFARGARRDVHPLVGRRCSAVLCREIEDLAEVSTQLPPHSTDLIFWPGIMRPAVDGNSAPDALIEHAQALARATGAWLVQANWPNSLNYPEECAEAGHSLVIDAEGRIRLRLPMAEAGLGVFDLGAPIGEDRLRWWSSD